MSLKKTALMQFIYIYFQYLHGKHGINSIKILLKMI